MGEAPLGPALQQLSVDGAMVPLRGMGRGEDPGHRNHRAVCAGVLNFSRMTDHRSFGRLAMVETHRRGTESAGKVCAVMDGADGSRGSSA